MGSQGKSGPHDGAAGGGTGDLGGATELGRTLAQRGHPDAGAGVVINPAGLSFFSVPVLDALKMLPGPVFELHISNIHRREAVYHRSLMSRAVTGVIAGLGAAGYRYAVLALAERLEAGE